MPIAPLIGAGASLLGTGIQTAATGKQNRKSREFSRDMYKQQHQDALEFWNMQNEYNSPSAQMQRYREAGINPHEIVSKGSPGQASPIPVPKETKPEFKVPDFSGIGNSILNYADIEMKQAQTNNVLSDTAVKFEEALLKAAQRLSIEKGTERTEFDLNFDREYIGILGDARRENLRQMRAKTDILLSQEERNKAMHGKNMEQAAENILQTRIKNSFAKIEKAKLQEQLQELKSTNVIKKAEANLAKNNIFKGDNLWFRQLGQMLDPKKTYSASDFIKKFKKAGGLKFDWGTKKNKSGISW